MTADKPKCCVEVINPDDILVVGINNKWFRSFTSSSDRYPIRIEVPSGFLNESWNLVTGAYSSVALVGKNDANVEYKVLLDDKDVVHVTYRTEVEPQHFTVTFKDTFSLKARSVTRGASAQKKSSRYADMMAWHKEAPAPLHAEDAPLDELPPEGPPGGPPPPKGRLL